MIKKALGFLFLLVNQMLFAQSITGIIKDSTDGTAINQVRITAYGQSDSICVYSDAKGRFVLQPLDDMRLVRFVFSHMSYEPMELNYSNESPIEVYLNPKTTLLDEVVIKQEFLSRKDGNTIVNISRIPNITNLQFDQILARIPGLIKTGEGNYSLNGRSAVIYINGVKQFISASSLATFLSSLPADAVSSVELIPINSGEYSASTEAVINVKINPNIPLGYSFQPSLYSSFIQEGVKDIGANLFYMTKIGRLLFHNSFSYSNEKVYSDYRDSLFLVNQVPLIYKSSRRGRLNVLTYNASLRYTLANNHSLGFNAFIYYDTGKPTSQWDTPSNKSLIQRKERSDLYNFSLSYQIPSTNLTFNGNIGYAFSYGGVYEETDYISSNGEQYNHSDVRMSGFLNTIYADLHSTFGDWKLNYGLQADYNGVRDKSLYQDGRRSVFGGFEVLPALYAHIQYPISKYLALKGGLRMETTYYQYDLDGEAPTKSYTSFFPSFLMNGDFSNYAFQIGLVSNIIRPKYQLMIPGLRQISDYMYYSGNPRLKPSNGYGLVLNNTFFGYAQLNFKLALITNYPGSTYTKENNYFIRSTKNISDHRYFTTNLVLPFSFFEDKLMGHFQANGTYAKSYNFRNNYMLPLGRPSSYWSHNYNINVNYSPTNRFTIALYGSYNPPFFGTMQDRSWNTSWNLELNYSFLKERNLTLFLGAYNIFEQDSMSKSYFLENTIYSKFFSIGPSIMISLKYRLNKGQKVIEEYRDYTPNSSRMR